MRNLVTTHMLDRLAIKLGEECYEVPVGFKHIVESMQEHKALLGGESSGGLTIRGHILGKDGIFAAALIVEMLARTGQKVSQLRETVFGLTGRLYALEESLPATPEMRVAVPRRLKEMPAGRIGPYPVLRVSQMDGTKLYLENDNWAWCASPEPSPCCAWRWKPIRNRKPPSWWSGCDSSCEARPLCATAGSTTKTASTRSIARMSRSPGPTTWESRISAR